MMMVVMMVIDVIMDGIESIRQLQDDIMDARAYRITLLDLRGMMMIVNDDDDQ